MRVICHIGHHKTGTTTLQAFLSQNFAPLQSAGILYPWTETEGAALALSGVAGRAQDTTRPLPINFREAHNALAFRMLAEAMPKWKVPAYHKHLPHSRQMLLAIRNQIRALEPDCLVLCSEVMSHFGKAAPDQITRLQTEAFPNASQINLWCTLRRPDDHLVSWHGQQVRFGNAPAPLSDPDRGLDLDWLHFDYRGVVEPWLNLIDGAIPILRPYAETLAEGGSVDDFLKQSGLVAPHSMTTTASLNISRKPALVTLLRAANNALPRPLAQELAQWLDDLAPKLTLAPTAEVEFFGPAARARLCDRFEPIHRWLSQTTGRQAFFTDIDQMAICRPITETDALHQLLDQLSPKFTHPPVAPEIHGFLNQQRDAL